MRYSNPHMQYPSQQQMQQQQMTPTQLAAIQQHQMQQQMHQQQMHYPNQQQMNPTQPHYPGGYQQPLPQGYPNQQQMLQHQAMMNASLMTQQQLQGPGSGQYAPPPQQPIGYHQQFVPNQGLPGKQEEVEYTNDSRYQVKGGKMQQNQVNIPIPKLDPSILEDTLIEPDLPEPISSKGKTEELIVTPGPCRVIGLNEITVSPKIREIKESNLEILDEDLVTHYESGHLETVIENIDEMEKEFQVREVIIIDETKSILDSSGSIQSFFDEDAGNFYRKLKTYIKSIKEIKTLLWFKALDDMFTKKVNDFLKVNLPEPKITIDSFIEDFGDLNRVLEVKLKDDSEEFIELFLTYLTEYIERLSEAYDVTNNLVIAEGETDLEKPEENVYMTDVYTSVVYKFTSYQLGIHKLTKEQGLVSIPNVNSNLTLTSLISVIVSLGHPEFILTTIDGRSYQLSSAFDAEMTIKAL